MFKLYSSWLQRHPIKTKCVTNGLLMSLGDFLTQTFFERKPFDLKRNLDLFFISFCYGAPILHFWYCKLLPKIRSTLYPNVSKPVNVFLSMLFDELAFGPVIYSLYFPAYEIIKDRDLRSLGKGIQSWREKIWETLVSSWKLWPLATTFNFWFIPIKYQVLFVNSVGLFWMMVMSYIVSK